MLPGPVSPTVLPWNPTPSKGWLVEVVVEVAAVQMGWLGTSGKPTAPREWWYTLPAPWMDKVPEGKERPQGSVKKGKCGEVAGAWCREDLAGWDPGAAVSSPSCRWMSRRRISRVLQSAES